MKGILIRGKDGIKTIPNGTTTKMALLKFRPTITNLMEIKKRIPNVKVIILRQSEINGRIAESAINFAKNNEITLRALAKNEKVIVANRKPIIEIEIKESE